MRCGVTGTSTDSSAWIEYYRETGSDVHLAVKTLADTDGGICIPAIVLSEILRGYDDQLQAKRVERQLLGYPVIEHELSDYVAAANLHRTARRAGITIRGTIDCLIAATCIRTGTTLLHADSDFDRLATCSELAVFPL